MATLDWLIIGLYFILLAMIVRWVLKHKKDDTNDYFLSGRGETWLAVGAGIFGANIGSEHLVGLAGAGASSGMAMAHWEMQGWMILILGWVFVPFYAHSKVFTMPEFLKRRFNRNASSTLSLITLIGYVITKKGKSISDRAELEEFVEQGNYDSEYYISHQVIPAVIKIIQEFGFDEKDLIHGGKQSNLSAFG